MNMNGILRYIGVLKGESASGSLIYVTDITLGMSEFRDVHTVTSFHVTVHTCSKNVTDVHTLACHSSNIAHHVMPHFTHDHLVISQFTHGGFA